MVFGLSEGRYLSCREYEPWMAGMAGIDMQRQNNDSENDTADTRSPNVTVERYVELAYIVGWGSRAATSMSLRI